MNRGLSDINSPQSKASNRRKRREKRKHFMMVGLKTSRGLGGAGEATSDGAMSQRFLEMLL